MFKKILVCLDGSKLAEQVLSYVAGTGKALGSKIVMLKILDQPEYGLTDKTNIPVKPSRAIQDFETMKHDARTYLKRVAEPLKAAKLEIEYVICTGEVGTTIVDYAKKNQIDLVAMATHGYGGLKRAVLGSVSDHVARNLNIPMLIIRPKGK